MSLSKLAIIAGGGHLPFQIVEAAQKMGRPYFIVGLKGFVDEARLQDHPHILLPLGKGGAAISAMKKAGVSDVVMIGPVTRPAFTSLKLDWWSTKLLAKIVTKSLGDDGLLKVIARALEAEGFNLVGAHEILSDLVAAEGCYTQKTPSQTEQEDCHYGIKVAHELGRLDIGQAVIVQEGLILAVEAIEGTKALIARSVELIRDGRHHPILIKACKPQQDPRLDMPTIGVETVEQVAAAGFSGIAIEAGKTQIVDFEQTISCANRHKIFIIGLSEATEEA